MWGHTSVQACVLSRFNYVGFFVTLWTAACQAPWSMGFSRQEYCSGLPFLSPGDLSHSGIEHGSLALQTDSLPSEPPAQFSSVAQSCLTLCNPVNRSTPGLPVHHLPVHHHLLEFTQTHVHRVGDAIQPSHPLSSPSPPAFYFSHHWGLFQ